MRFPLKVSKFQNEFMKSISHRFSQNMNKKLSGFLPYRLTAHCAEILTTFRSYFGRNDDFILKFTDLYKWHKNTYVADSLFFLNHQYYKNIFWITFIPRSSTTSGYLSIASPSQKLWSSLFISYVIFCKCTHFLWDLIFAKCTFI